eukprot:3355257-Pyramimonas_sp.AAC.1
MIEGGRGRSPGASEVHGVYDDERTQDGHQDGESDEHEHERDGRESDAVLIGERERELPSE